MGVRGLDRGEIAALVTIECQNGPTNPAFSPDQALAQQCEERGTIKNIAALSSVCRDAGVRIFHCKLVHRRDWAGSGVNSLLLGANKKRQKMLEGSPEVQLHPDLGADPQDFEIERMTGVTAFFASPLEILLRNCGVETVILTGVSTNLGIPGAAIEAVNRGFSVVIPEDGIAGVWPEAHEFHVEHTLPILATVTSCADIKSVLEARDRPSSLPA
jgi:nicotinamidase-related amidase